MGDRGKGTCGKRCGVIGLGRMDVGSCGDEEAVFESLGHLEGVVGDTHGCDKERGDPLDRASLAPSCGFPEILRGGVVEEVMCPFALGSSDSAAEGFDGRFAGRA